MRRRWWPGGELWAETDVFWKRATLVVGVLVLVGMRAWVHLYPRIAGRDQPVEFWVTMAEGDSEVAESRGNLSEQDERIWRVAGKAAQEVVGAAQKKEHGGRTLKVGVTWQRGKRGRGAPLGESRGGSVAVWASGDAVKDAFRAGHECGHAVASWRFGAGRLPLWTEEGLAQLSGFRAAEEFARTVQRSAVRKPPGDGPGWASLGELVARRDYPSDTAEVAAFYWQSAALVRAIQARLGPANFAEFLSGLADGADWEALLRERWWFADGDFRRLERQIAPDAPPVAAEWAGWTL